MTANAKLKSGVYAIIHKDSGKRYIGSSKNTPKRLAYHASHLRANTHFNDILQHAWNKYGETAFERHQILVCAPEDRLFYEQLLIDGYKTLDREFGYNLSLKAEYPSHSAATRLKIKDAVARARAEGKMVGNHKPHSQEARKKIKASLAKAKSEGRVWGHRKKHTAESRKKISESLMGRSSWNRGIPMNDKSKRKLSESQKKRLSTPEQKQRLAAKKKDHCKYGHLHKDNSYISLRGERVCRRCRHQRVLKHRAINPRRGGK